MGVLVAIIGLRHQVGGDWSGYLQIFSFIDSPDFASGSVSVMMDPGYLMLNKISSVANFGVYGVNVMCASIFSVGLVVFCRQLPRPLLGLAVAVPYLVIVVAMGYSRQSVALGLAMLAYTALRNDYIWKFIICILVAATFHKTAIGLLPLLLASQTTNRVALIFWGLCSAPLFYFLFLADSMGFLLEHYVLNVEEIFVSQGAFIRLGMNLIPALIFLAYSHRLSINQSDKNFLNILSWVTIISFAALFFTEASAAIDRLALYLLPLQILIFSYLPNAFTNNIQIRQFIVLGILLYYSFVLFVWLNFGVHSEDWLPYQSVILDGSR
jgi:hypothetical protein